MIRVIVKSENVNNRAGTGKNGKPFSFREQGAALENGGDFPYPIKLRLERDQPAYKPGVYTFSPESYRVDDFGNPELRYVTLVPFDAVKPGPVTKAA